jgi:hypothetical protein
MRELSFESQVLVAEARAALGPSAAVRRRIRSGVAARVAAGGAAAATLAAATETAASHAPAAAAAGAASAGWSALAKLVAATSIAAALAGSGWGLWRLAENGPRDQAAAPAAALAPAPPPRAAAPALAPAPPAAQAGPSENPPAAEPAAPPRPRRAEPAPTARTGQLALELDLVRGAQRSLRAGAPDEALSLLARHAREVRAPQMEPEARLLRAEALCRAGRLDEGRRELASARARWQSASGLAAVEQACDADPP